jgi:hypothetical protein
LLVLAAALAIGSLGASLARSAGDPLPSVTRALDASFSRPVGRASISMDIWQVVGTSGDFVLMRPAEHLPRTCSMLPDDWYYGGS